jgi:hypothetical protein
MATLLGGESASQLSTNQLFVRRLESMTASMRLTGSRDGSFTHAERALWAAHYPEEVPLVNDELEWIALSLADLD